MTHRARPVVCCSPRRTRRPRTGRDGSACWAWGSIRSPRSTPSPSGSPNTRARRTRWSTSSVRNASSSPVCGSPRRGPRRTAKSPSRKWAAIWSATMGSAPMWSFAARRWLWRTSVITRGSRATRSSTSSGSVPIWAHRSSTPPGWSSARCAWRTWSRGPGGGPVWRPSSRRRRNSWHDWSGGGRRAPAVSVPYVLRPATPYGPPASMRRLPRLRPRAADHTCAQVPSATPESVCRRMRPGPVPPATSAYPRRPPHPGPCDPSRARVRASQAAPGLPDRHTPPRQMLSNAALSIARRWRTASSSITASPTAARTVVIASPMRPSPNSGPLSSTPHGPRPWRRGRARPKSGVPRRRCGRVSRPVPSVPS